MLTLALAAALLAGPTAPAQPSTRMWPQGFIEVSVAGGWSQPVGLTFAEDGRMFVWEKGGKVWNVEDGVKAAQPLIDLGEEVGNWRDFGLLGFALDPDFYDNGHIYLLYVVDYHHLKYFGTPQYDPWTDEYFHDTIGRLVRYTCTPADGFRSVDPASRTVLIGETIDTGFPILHQSHGIGTLVFGDDGTLLISCGDGASYATVDTGGPIGGSSNTGLAEGIIRPEEDVGAYRAQMVDSLSGKILRIDPATGDGLPSNPWYDPAEPRAARSRVWALGLRNPFRVTILPGSGSHLPADGNPGTLFIGDVGWNDWEEVNLCDAPGLNFGWPIYEGMERQLSYLGKAPANSDAPNPLFGSGGCTQEFFDFEDLLVQETLATPSWPNPCDPGQQIPASVHPFMHTRPLVDWYHGSGPSRTKTFDGVTAAHVRLDDPSSPISGPNFGGNCAVGCTFIASDVYGPQFERSIVFGDYAANFLYTLALDALGEPLSVSTLSAPGEASALVAAAFDDFSDALYFIEYDNTGGTGVKRLVNTNDKPPTAVATATPQYGPAPLSVQLTGSGSSDPEGQALTYLWEFDDGSGSTLADPQHVFAHVEDITDQGTIVARIFELDPPEPMGGGSKDPEVIRDGDRPEVGTFAPTRQYDTYHQGDQAGVDWIGYTFAAPRQLRSLVFQEGMNYADGGWFDTLDVQVFDGSTWSSVTGLSAAPLYTGQDPDGFETFLLSFDPVSAQGVRLFGDPGGSSSFISVAELRVLATAATSPGPSGRDVRLSVTDAAGNVATTTLSVSLDNTPPQVQITSPVDGSYYSMDDDTLVPMNAIVSDAEHDVSELECSWQVTLHHDEHNHPEPPDPTCSTSAVISPVGCDGHTYYYEFTLTVRDPAGLETVRSAFMFPDCCGATDPLPVVACPGEPASFSTTPTGTPPFTYQWRKDGVDIPGANADTYTIATVDTGDAGDYSVVVAGSCGTAETPAAALTVNTPVTTTPPADASVCEGAPASFSTSAGGTGPLTYQWLKDGAPVPGATDATLSLPAVAASDAGAYSVEVTGACGTVESVAAILTVDAPTTATPPSGATVCPDEPVSFSTTPGGTGPFTFQWRKDGADIPGATSDTYAIAAVDPADAGAYTVVVTGACGTVETPAATLVVNSPTTASPPSGATVCEGSPASFSTTPGGTEPFTFQWRKDGADIPGATAATYSIAATTLDDAGAYTVVVIGACGPVESSPATLVVDEPLSASAPAGAEVCPGDPVSFSTTPGGTGPFTYQWRKDGVSLPGAVSASYSIAAVTEDDAGAYTVVVTGACGSVESDPASLVVRESVTASAPVDVEACPGEPAGFSTTPGGTGPFTFQWRKDGADIPGATAASYSIAAVTPADAGAYSVVVTGACDSIETAAAVLTVDLPTTATPPASADVCEGNPVSFSTTPGGSGPFIFQWRKDGADIPGATAATYSIAAVTPADAGAYSVVVTGACDSIETAPAVLTVGEPLSATPPAGATVCEGGPASFSTTPGGTGPFTFQWRKDGSSIPGATADTYSIAAVTPADAGAYTVVVTGACGSIETAPAVLTVDLAVSATPPADATACVGSPASFSTTPGGTGPFTFQWRKDGADIPGATSDSYSIAAVTPADAGAYSVVVTGACGSVETAGALLAVDSPTTATPPSDATVCEGSPASFSTTPGGTGPFTFQWRKDGADIPDATSDTYAIAAVTPADAGAYSVVVTGACGLVETGPAVLTVDEPVSASDPQDAVVCVGGQASFATTATGTGPLGYQWHKDGSPIPGATEASLTISAVDAGDAGAYSVVVTGACGSVETADAELVVSGVSTTYCTAKVNSQGCTPAIGAQGVPSASAGSGYRLGATQVLPGVPGVFFYSTTGPAAVPFQGGFLCAASPILRTPGQYAAGSGSCGGIFRLDFNAYIAGGTDPKLVAGAQFWGQFWSRDPASPSGSSLTDAVTAVICP
jgi:glucose/arabinose dehydrogenase